MSSTPGRVRFEEGRLYPEPTGVTDRQILIDQHEVGIPDVLYWPSVVPMWRVAQVSNPLGRYYLYYSASHADSSIRLAYADEPLGPYTDYGPVFEDPDAGPQTETPEVVWNPDTEQFHLYYHGFLGKNQSTALAFSQDGLDWEKHGVVVDTIPHTGGNDHTGYLRVHRFGDYWLGLHQMGGGGSTGFGVSYSTDGVTWRTDPRRLNSVDQTRSSTYRIKWTNSRLVQWNGQLYWIGVVGPRDPWGPVEDGFIGWAPLADERSLRGPPVPLVEPNEPWEGIFTYTPEVLVEDDTWYLYYGTIAGSIHGAGDDPAGGHIAGARITWGGQ